MALETIPKEKGVFFDVKAQFSSQIKFSMKVSLFMQHLIEKIAFPLCQALKFCF